MATKIGSPPGTARCDWCCKRVAWKTAEMTQDNEVLCLSCWTTYSEIVSKTPSR